MTRSRLLGLLIMTLFVTTACTRAVDTFSPPVLRDTRAPPSSQVPSSLTPTIPPTSPTGPDIQGSRVVTFRSSDGTRLGGRLFGQGPVGVVLAHGNEPELAQSTWFAFAQILVRHGYRVLTFDFRGFCPGGVAGCSEGGLDAPRDALDAAAAVAYLQTHSASEVFLIGASLGGHAALFAASRAGVHVAGVVSVSSPQPALAGPPSYDISRKVLQAIRAPKLFMAGADDTEFAHDARSMFAAAAPPKRLLLVPSGLHGSELLTPSQDPSVVKAIADVLGFLAAHR